MADTKFTPGPWVYDEDRRHIVRDGDYDVCSIDIGWNESDQSELAEMDATAHLISAAPELYEALYRLVRDCEIAGLQEQAGFDCWINMANKALAKARGEAPS
ncbi:hypothetical protein [Ochrobactrum sp. Marseille-Q0166]|uniref:hypothetical protein n=1 Tax=Ochrobactrum sp. Marseille-Q0166 TaxID=2761105 RepID=UPI00165558C2|nr:hypothetical protein [Ochrobactrum sp. Marseille-Q0166]MBC8718801.1 hypothetical protein [Ochrobactrum sp. Marseille-Q0166]